MHKYPIGARVRGGLGLGTVVEHQLSDFAPEARYGIKWDSLKAMEWMVPDCELREPSRTGIGAVVAMVAADRVRWIVECRPIGKDTWFPYASKGCRQRALAIAEVATVESAGAREYRVVPEIKVKP